MGTSNKSLAVILNLILLTILGTWVKATFVDGVDVSKIIKIVREEGDYSDLSVFFIVVFIPLMVFYLVYFLICKVFKKDVSSLLTKSLTVGIVGTLLIYVISGIGGGFAVIYRTDVGILKRLLPFFLLGLLLPYSDFWIRQLLNRIFKKKIPTR